MQSVSIVIVAAGSGVRMAGMGDKMFLELAGLPLVAHTWKRFDLLGDACEIILVVREESESAFSKLAKKIKPEKNWRLVGGGAQRQESVWNGLKATSPGSELVAIQDGARPCTPVPVIQATLTAARETGAAVAACRVTDTIKQAGKGNMVEKTLDRSGLWAVQTPQAFRRDVLLRALKEVRKQGVMVTDDTAACELIGHPVQLVECAGPNPKATMPADLPYIESLLETANR